MGVTVPRSACLGAMDPVAPLATLDKRPDDKRPPVIKRNTVSTVEGAEPPGPPYHLFFISVDGSILSTPRMVPEKPARRGGAPRNSQTPLPCVQISLPSKTDTSVTPGGWCRSQRAPIFILTSLRGNFPRSRISNLKSQGLCARSVSPQGSIGHRGTEALRWGAYSHHG